MSTAMSTPKTPRKRASIPAVTPAVALVAAAPAVPSTPEPTAVPMDTSPHTEPIGEYEPTEATILPPAVAATLADLSQPIDTDAEAAADAAILAALRATPAPAEPAPDVDMPLRAAAQHGGDAVYRFGLVAED